MANQTITQLPTANALTGTELVPVVQDGGTVKTTVADIAATPVTNYSFVTATSQGSLSQSRQLTTSGNGLTLTDNGAGSTLVLSLSGAAASLVAAGTGIQVKTSATTLTGRSIASGTAGLSVADGDGIAGNPTVSLSGIVLNLAQSSGVGLLTRTSGNSIGIVTLQGTANEIDVANGTGNGSDPTVGLADNPVVPGLQGIVLPSGATGDRSGSPTNGTLRYNSQTGTFEGYANSAWGAITTGTGVTSITAGTGLTGGTITSTGTIAIDNTVVATLTDAQTLTNKTISGASNTLTNISNASLTNSSVTYNGVSVALGASGTITAANPNALTVGTGLQLDSGTTYDGSAARTISLTNTSITIGSTAIALGGSSLTLAGLTSVTVTQDPTTAYQLATKQYVDGLVSTGLVYHQPVQAATTQSLAAQTGGSVTYNNGTLGVGATLTLGVALTTLDGYSLVNGDRILVKNESNQAHNGIYTWATGGTVLTRATDADSYGTGTNELSENDYFFVQNGTVNKGTSYVLTTSGTITFGTTAITFAEFSTSQVYTGSSPIQVTGTVISLNTVPVASGGTNITSYTAGDILYASGATTLSKLGIGTSTYILTSSGTAPQYTDPATITVGAATTAGSVTNSITFTNTGGASPGTTFNGSVARTIDYSTVGAPKADGTGASGTWSINISGSAGSATTATTATNVAGGAAGSLVYQTGASTTSTLALGTQGYVLRAGASAPEWATIDGGTF
jgi:hypothetical protein